MDPGTHMFPVPGVPPYPVPYFGPGLPMNTNMGYPNGAQPLGPSFMGMGSMVNPQVPIGVGQQFGKGMGQGNSLDMPGLASATYTPVNHSQDIAQAVMHLENFKSLLQELPPGVGRVKSDEKRLRTSMGSGRHLTFEDLKQHMNVGLKEAANQLGICPTTLKRTCRRLGITRWPCRQLAKLNRTMSELGYKHPPPEGVLEAAFKGQLKTSDLTKELSSCTLLSLWGHFQDRGLAFS